VAEVIVAQHLVVDLEGHTDSVEKAPGLSLRRAEMVRDQLVARGVDPARLRVVDHRATRPIAPSPAKAIRPRP